MFNVSLPSSAQVLRVVAMPAQSLPAEELDPSYASGLAAQQNAYDWYAALYCTA